jgi:CubicO group peptidase (beta-lactamase class C family)
MLEYSRAWDQGGVVSAASRAAAWSPAVSPTRGALPYGLGWFVTELDDTPVVWHYGLWIGNSSLIVKLPERGITLVLLANSDQLSARYPLGAGDLLSSPFARALLAWALQRDVRG